MTVIFATWTGAETALVITACGTFLSAVVSAVGVLVSLKNRSTLVEVKKQTDGLTQKLVTSEKAVSKAEGKVEERAEVAERVVAQDAATALRESKKIQLPPP